MAYNTLINPSQQVGSLDAAGVTPSSSPYAQQNVATPMAGISNMVKALIEGNQQYQMQQKQQQAQQNSGVPTGQPLDIVPKTGANLQIPMAPSYVPTWQRSWDPNSSSGALW